MAAKKVLVHRCKHSDLDDGSPLNCSCKMKISLTQAKRRVADGLAAWKKAPLGAVCVCNKGGECELHRQVLLYGRQPKVPGASTIVKSHIEKAFVCDNRFARERIEEYGEANQKVLVELGAVARTAVFLSGKTTSKEGVL